MEMPRYTGVLCDVPGFRLGHDEDLQAMTGVSVILPPAGTVGGVDVRGAAPGTRETDLLKPENWVEEVHGLTLSGGSAFGLATADGVMRFLREKEIGLEVGVGRVPIVPGCVLFDLWLGDAKAYPDAESGFRAASKATERDASMGNIGAGCGATVGKLRGPASTMKSGLGQASMKRGDLIVSCVVAVNAVGDVVDPFRGNEPIAGLRTADGLMRSDTMQEILSGENLPLGAGNTTIAAVATNAKLQKAGCLRVAQMAHDGYARAIRPVHTMSDGDTIFCLASGEVEADINLIGIMAAEVIAKGIVNAAMMAECSNGLPAYRNLVK